MKLRTSVRAAKGVLWLIAYAVCVAGAAEAKINKKIVNGKSLYDIEVNGIEQTSKELFGESYVVTRLLGVEGNDGINYAVGEPHIPVVRFFVEGDGQITVLPGSSFMELESLGSYLMPQQFSVAKIAHATMPFAFNAASYERDEFAPGREFDVREAGVVRGVKRRLVTLYPYSYNPVTGDQRLRKTYEVIVENHNDQPQHINPQNETMVFVVGKKFARSPSLAAYQNAKRRLGYYVYQEVVDGALSSPEKIRDRLKDYYNSSAHDLRYVVLVGDIEDVPAFVAKKLSSRLDFETLEEIKYPTDHYYRLMEDEDMLDGAMSGVDVSVGRISVSSEQELRTVLSKYTRYENGNFRDDHWLKQSSFIATDDQNFYEIAEGTHDFVTEMLMRPKNFLGNFPEIKNLGGDRLYAIRHEANGGDLLTALNEGRGIVSYSGHGGLSEWHAPHFSIEDLDRVANQDAIPFVISNACITGQFSQKVSFAEAWQRHPKGGVFFWGSVDSTYWDEDDVLERKFYELAIKQDELRFAKLTETALNNVWRYFGGQGRSEYYLETYTSFGDPSLQLRTERLEQPRILLTRPVERRFASQVNLTVVDSKGRAVKGARVVLELAGKRYVTLSENNGAAHFNVDPGLMRWRQRLGIRVSGKNISSKTFYTEVGLRR